MHAAEDSSGHLWFVRRGDRVCGPFPLGALRQEQLLGRLHEVTAFSADGYRWVGPNALGALLENDHERSATADDWSRQRAIARLRWADQRRGVDRRTACDPGSAWTERRGGHERRTVHASARELPVRREEPDGGSAERNLTWIVLGLLAAIAAGAFVYGPSHPVSVQITVPAQLR
ncbi:MAG: hypothetical protein KIS79_14400 [Burkholderiales bacterium]|nr:hypothetical protein [Burkholderiales bacterium]